MAGYRYEIIKDVKQDAWNWWDGCNSTGHGVDWKQRVDGEAASKIVGKNQDEAFAYLQTYLKTEYDKNPSIRRGEEFVRARFQQYFTSACEKLVEITGRPLYRSDFTVYLTTFPRGPYDYERGAIWLPVLWINPIANFMHEVLHFQFIHYWRDSQDSEVAKLSQEDFERLKEALTVVLDESLLPLIEKVDTGYDDHRVLRDKLHEHWLNNHDFDALVEHGLKLVAG